MFKRIKKQTPLFKRSTIRQGNYGILKNRFRYRGVMDKYLKIDAGELIMHEGIRYQGEIIDDFFEGQGELYLVDGFELKGKWNKGILEEGSIYFTQIDDLKYLEIVKDGNQKKYFLYRKTGIQEIIDKIELEFFSENKKYKAVFQVSQYRGVMIEIEITIPMKTLYSKMYKIYYTINSSIVFRKEFIIETCSFSLEIFANYKTVYTLLNKEQRKTQVNKVLVYSDGTVFGGEVIFYKQQNFDPFKYRSKIKSMPGYYLDLDDYDRNRNVQIPYYTKFSFQKNSQKHLQGILYKQSKEIPSFLKLILESLLNFALNFFSLYAKELLEKKQIHFDWYHFDKEYFQKIVELKKHDFSYSKRMSRGFLANKKLEKFDWSQKQSIFKNFKQVNQLILSQFYRLQSKFQGIIFILNFLFIKQQ